MWTFFHCSHTQHTPLHICCCYTLTFSWKKETFWHVLRSCRRKAKPNNLMGNNLPLLEWCIRNVWHECERTVAHIFQGTTFFVWNGNLFRQLILTHNLSKGGLQLECGEVANTIWLENSITKNGSKLIFGICCIITLLTDLLKYPNITHESWKWFGNCCWIMFM